MRTTQHRVMYGENPRNYVIMPVLNCFNHVWSLRTWAHDVIANSEIFTNVLVEALELQKKDVKNELFI